MSTIHGKSCDALRFFHDDPASLSVYWAYCARSNHEGVAWPSLRNLATVTRWAVNSCSDARHWLVEHKALELVADYIRPEWRKLAVADRTRRLNLDQAEYYRRTGYIEVDGRVYPLLYFGGQDASSVDENSTDAPIPPMSHGVIHETGSDQLPMSHPVIQGSTSHVSPQPTSDVVILNLVPITDKEKDSVTPVGATVPTPSNPPMQVVKKERPRDPWYDCVNATWGYEGSYNGGMQKMLQGTSKDQKFTPGNVPDHIKMTPDDVLNWAAWYRHTELHDNPHLNMLEDRQKIASSIERWHNLGRPDVRSKTITPEGGEQVYDPTDFSVVSREIPTFADAFPNDPTYWTDDDPRWETLHEGATV